MPKDLRTFLQRLEERAPTELVRVKREVDPVLELSGVVRRLQADQRYPAVLFDKVKGSKLRAISNVLGSTQLLAEALETSIDNLTQAYIEREDERIAGAGARGEARPQLVLVAAAVQAHAQRLRPVRKMVRQLAHVLISIGADPRTIADP